MAEQPPTAGGVILGTDDPFKGLPDPVKQRVGADITATTLIAEAKNMLYRAQLLLVADVGHWVDAEGNVDLSSRIEVALKVLDGRSQ